MEDVQMAESITEHLRRRILCNQFTQNGENFVSYILKYCLLFKTLHGSADSLTV